MNLQQQACARYGHVFSHTSMKCIYCGHRTAATVAHKQTKKQTIKGGVSDESLVSSGTNEH